MDLKRKFHVKASYWEGRNIPSISDPATFSLNEENWVKDRVYYEEPMIRRVNPRFGWTQTGSSNSYHYPHLGGGATPRGEVSSFDWFQPVDGIFGSDHLFLPFNSTFIKYSPNCASAIRGGFTWGEASQGSINPIHWQYHPNLGAAKLPNMRHWSNYRSQGSTGDPLRRITAEKIHTAWAEKSTAPDGRGIKSGFTTKADSSYNDWANYMLDAYSWEGDDYIAKDGTHDCLAGPQQMIRLTDAWPAPIWDPWRYAGSQRRAFTYSNEHWKHSSFKDRENVTSRGTYWSYYPPYSLELLRNGINPVTVRSERVPLNYGYFIGYYANQDIVVRFAWIRGVPLGGMDTENSYWEIGESWQQEYNIIPWWKKVTHSNGTSFQGRHIRVRFYKTAGEHVYRQTAPSDDYLIDTHYYPLDYEFHKGSPVAVYNVGKNDYISAFVDFDWPIPEGINESAFENYPHGVGHLVGTGFKDSADLAQRAAHLVSGACYWGGFEIFTVPSSGANNIAGQASKWSRVEQPYIKSNDTWKKAEYVYKKHKSKWELVHSGKQLPLTVVIPVVPLSAYYTEQIHYDPDPALYFHYQDFDLAEYIDNPEKYGVTSWKSPFTSKQLRSAPFTITVIVESGVRILGPLTIKNLNRGGKVILKNYGYIYGLGGAGGPSMSPIEIGSEAGLQQWSDLDGQDGGPAIETDHNLSIFNHGRIYGGAGGGHGGMPEFVCDLGGQLFYDKYHKRVGLIHGHGGSLALPSYWKAGNGFEWSTKGGIPYKDYTRGWYEKGKRTVFSLPYWIPEQGYWKTTMKMKPFFFTSSHEFPHNTGTGHNVIQYWGWTRHGMLVLMWVPETVWVRTSPARLVQPEISATGPGDLVEPSLNQAVFWTVAHGAAGGGGAVHGPSGPIRAKNQYWTEAYQRNTGLGYKWGEFMANIIWESRFDLYDKDAESQFDFEGFSGDNTEDVTVQEDCSVHHGQTISGTGSLKGVLKKRAVWGCTPILGWFGKCGDENNADHTFQNDGPYHFCTAVLSSTGAAGTAWINNYVRYRMVKEKREVLEVWDLRGGGGDFPFRRPPSYQGDQGKGRNQAPWSLSIVTSSWYDGPAYRRSPHGQRTRFTLAGRQKTPSYGGSIAASKSGPVHKGGIGGTVNHAEENNYGGQRDDIMKGGGQGHPNRWRERSGGIWKRYLGGYDVINHWEFPGEHEIAKNSYNLGAKAWIESWKTKGGNGGEPGEPGESFTLDSKEISRFGQKIILPSITLNGGGVGNAVVITHPSATVVFGEEGDAKGGVGSRT